MAAEGDNNFIRYVYRGEEDEVIPLEATHITVLAKVIPRRAFQSHPNIVEVICSERVKKIKNSAFCNCPYLHRVIMPNVKIVEGRAFYNCGELTDVECGQLEVIRRTAFRHCRSLRVINMQSVRILEREAFGFCEALMEVKFGSKLESFGWSPFLNCTSLERITIPLKDGLIDDSDSTFMGCERLEHVDLIEGEIHEAIAALHLDEWRNDMNEEIDSINKDLLDSPGGGWDDEYDYDPGEKASDIYSWIRSVLRKIIHYQTKHGRILDEAATTLQFALPQDIMMNNVLPFLALPSHTFEVEEDEDEDY